MYWRLDFAGGGFDLRARSATWTETLAVPIWVFCAPRIGGVRGVWPGHPGRPRRTQRPPGPARGPAGQARGGDDAFGERPLLAPPAWRFPGMSRWQGLLSAAGECLA